MPIKLCTIKKLADPILSLDTAVQENPLNLPLNHITSETDKLQLALQRGRLWKIGAVIPVSFVSGGSHALREKIVYYLKQWEQHGNVRFNMVDSSSAGAIRIAITDSGSSWSYIGTDHLAIPKDQHTMEFGWLDDNSPDAEIRRVVIHEFGHAIGCIHEHQNPSVSIPWDKPKVYEYYSKRGWDKATVDNNIFDTYDKESTNYSEFDRQSIMLYAIPEELTIGDYSVGWNSDLSAMDKQHIGVVYPKTDGPTPPVVVIEFKELQANTYHHAEISQPNEVDLYRFRLPFTQRVVIETSGNTNVVMALLNEARTQVLRYDDDSGAGRNAKIITKVSADTTYFIAIKHRRSTGKGGYRISLRALSL